MVKLLQNISGDAGPNQGRGFSHPSAQQDLRKTQAKDLWESPASVKSSVYGSSRVWWGRACKPSTHAHTAPFQWVPTAIGRHESQPASHLHDSPPQGQAPPGGEKLRRRHSVAAFVTCQDVKVAVCRGIVCGCALQDDVSARDEKEAGGTVRSAVT